MELTELVKQYNEGKNGLSTGMSFNIHLLQLLKKYNGNLGLLNNTVNQLNNMKRIEVARLLHHLQEGTTTYE